MGVIERFVQRPVARAMSLLRPVEKHALNSRLMPLFGDAAELPEPLDFERQSELGFRRNAIAHGCIRRISRSAAEPVLKAITVLPDGELETNTPQSGDPLARLLYSPNDEQDQYEFFEQLFIHLMVSGNAFVYKVRSQVGGPPVMLELIRPDLIGILPGKARVEGRVKGYSVRTDQSSARMFVPREDIIHFKMPDAFDEFWGLSPLYVASRYIDMDLQSADFLRSYFKNKGIPAGLLTFSTPMVSTERERIRELWRDQFQGIQGWHNVSVLDANVNYTPLAAGVEQMDISTVTMQTETRICMVFGVPPVLIGTLIGIEKSSFANLDASERIFWQDTMSPLFSRLSRRLSRRLAQDEFGENRQVVFDLSTVSALTENKSEVRKIALQGWRYGLLTRNQANRMLGLAKEDQNGDVYLMSSNNLLQPADQIAASNKVDDTVPQS